MARWVWTLVLCVAAVVACTLWAGEGMDREITKPVPEARIEVLKAVRLRRLYSGETLLREYPVGTEVLIRP